MTATITVCSLCRSAACWQGEFMCDAAAAAATLDVPLDLLRREAREHPSWWNICQTHGVAFRSCRCAEVVP